nr:peptidoglycan-binding protein [Candidatus Paceibacterota bacterium]
MNKFTKIFVGALAAVAIFASAASAAYTHTGLLKMGMTSSQVMSLQQALNSHGFLVSTTGAGSPGMESMYFGAKTKAAVMAYQSAKGLSPVDGMVGNITGTSLMANAGGGSGVYPAGCSSNSGFSTTTGLSCSSATLPTGCTSTAGFSPVTGMSCSGGS